MRLEETAKRIRVRAHLLGWPLDRVIDEIRRTCADCSLLEAQRLAHGLTRQQLSWAVDALYEGDGLPPPHLDPSDIWAWERGRHQPTSEHQRYLTRAYRTRPDRLGFGEDHSRPAQQEAPAAAPVEAVIEGAVLRAGCGSPAPASADELVVVVGPGVRRVSLRLAATPSSGTDRLTWSDPSRWPAPGALVGLAEDRIEIAVVARWGRSEHVIKVMDRRTFLALGIALPVAVTANHLDRLGDVLTTRRVDALAVEGLERIGAACRRAWNHVPAPELLPHVAWQIRLLEELRPTAAALRPRILTLIGAMATLAGRMIFRDLQDPGGAEDHLRTALTAAQEAGNPELTAYVLATWSYVVAARTARLTTAYGNGPLTEALQMVDEAQRLATTGGSLTTEAYVAAATSEIHACSGDELGSRRSIELGEGALSRRTDEDPLWIGHGRFDAVRLRANHAANLMRFQRPETVDVLRSVLGQYTDERRQTRVYPLANLARALVQQGEMVEGASCAAETLTLAVALGSGENIRRIRTLYGEDLREHRDHPAVRALGERLAVV